MIAPDKIYMPNELLSEEWQRHIEGEDTTYIRKDDILEWAEKKLQERHAPQFRDAIGQLIDKLESL